MAPSSAFENHGSAGGVPGIISCELRLLNRSTIVSEKWVLPPQWINIEKRIKFKPRKLQSSMSNSSSPETEATQLRCVLQDFGETQFNGLTCRTLWPPIGRSLAFAPDSIWELGVCAARFWTFKTTYTLYTFRSTFLRSLCCIVPIIQACLCCSHCLSMRRTESNSGRNAVTQVIMISLWFPNLSCFSKTWQLLPRFP